MIRFSCVVAVMVFVMFSLYAPIMGGVQCACWLYSYVIIILLLFDCCVWPVDALMLYLHFRDVGGIVTSNLENQMTFQFGKLHTFDLFTLASSSSANSENILKTATSE